MRKILHIDLNNFYASVECLHNPDLKNVPLAVCGSTELRHGIVLAKNDLAKSYGIKTGDVIWEAKNKCKSLVTVLPDFSLYLRFSMLARHIYEDYTDKIESFGIDECWLDVTESEKLFGSALDIAESIRKRIKDELGLTVSIGVSFNKIYAKLGSDYKKPDAITVIDENNYKEIVYPLPVKQLLYVGRATYNKLNAIGIKTIGELAEAPSALLKEKFGVVGEYLKTFASGQDDKPVKKKSAVSVVKSVGNSITTSRDMQSYKDMEVVINLLADSVAGRLRDYKLKASTVSIYVRSNELNTKSFQCKMPYNCSSSEIQEFAMKLFKANYKPPFKIRSIGIKASGLKEFEQLYVQLDIFDVARIEKQEALEKAMDKIRSRFGYNSVKKGILKLNEELTEFVNPKEEHIIHPISFLKG